MDKLLELLRQAQEALGKSEVVMWDLSQLDGVAETIRQLRDKQQALKTELLDRKLLILKTLVVLWWKISQGGKLPLRQNDRDNYGGFDGLHVLGVAADKALRFSREKHLSDPFRDSSLKDLAAEDHLYYLACHAIVGHVSLGRW